MALQVPLLAGEGVLGDGAHAGLELGHAVDEEERITVWDERFDAGAIQRCHAASLVAAKRSARRLRRRR